MLVTSCERLAITGELTYRVPSLTVPEASETLRPETVSRYEGVRLFVERAKLVRPDFDVTTENASAVASICARLDGMSLLGGMLRDGKDALRRSRGLGNSLGPTRPTWLVAGLPLGLRAQFGHANPNPGRYEPGTRQTSLRSRPPRGRT